MLLNLNSIVQLDWLHLIVLLLNRLYTMDRLYQLHLLSLAVILFLAKLISTSCFLFGVPVLVFESLDLFDEILDHLSQVAISIRDLSFFVFEKILTDSLLYFFIDLFHLRNIEIIFLLSDLVVQFHRYDFQQFLDLFFSFLPVDFFKLSF